MHIADLNADKSGSKHGQENACLLSFGGGTLQEPMEISPSRDRLAQLRVFV